MKCTIRGWFVNRGIAIDTAKNAWCTGRTLINSFRKPLADCQPIEFWKGQLVDIELTQMDALTEQLAAVVKKLEALGKNDPRSNASKPSGRWPAYGRDPRRLPG